MRRKWQTGFQPSKGSCAILVPELPHPEHRLQMSRLRATGGSQSSFIVGVGFYGLSNWVFICYQKINLEDNLFQRKHKEPELKMRACASVCKCIEQMCVFVCVCLCVYCVCTCGCAWMCKCMCACMHCVFVCVCPCVCVLGGDGRGRQITQRSGLPGRFLLKVL